MKGSSNRDKFIIEKVNILSKETTGVKFVSKESFAFMENVNEINTSDINDKGSVNSHFLNCFYTNIRSLMNNQKRDEMLALIEEHKIDIIGFTESWAHEGILDSEVSFAGFNLFRRDRADGRKGGGVMLFIRDSICAVDVTDKTNGRNESVWVKIRCKNKLELCIGVCYRSPNLGDEEYRCLMEAIKYFSEESVIIMGDFNFRDIDWKRLYANSSKGQDFLDVINDSFLTQHVYDGTRGGNVLDLIFSSDTGLVEDIEICCPISNSDHNSLLFKICVDVGDDSTSRVVYNYHKADLGKINSDLNDISWGDRFINKNVEAMWNELIGELMKCRDKYVPVRKITKGKCPKWMKKRILKKYKEKKQNVGEV